MKPKINFFAAALLLASAAGTLAGVHYVDVNSTNATPPYTNWTTAATNIQDAVDAAVAGDEIVVTNGTYFHLPLNPVSVRVDKPLSVRSVNGPEATIISPSGCSGCGCVYLTNGARLSGFTLTNGSAAKGGAVFCESQTAVVSNCVISGNRNFTRPGQGGGGGAFGGTLNNCTLTDNIGSGDVLGFGGGGGAAYCTLNNCTLTANSGGVGGGGAYACTLNNCIVYFNSGGNYDPSSALNYCCTTPLPPSGVGNITNAPLFVNTNGWANLRLQSNSPCINAGNNSYAPAGTDLDGNPRISGGTMDIGAYEFQSPASMISYTWLQQFSLPINPSTDTADPDGDGVDNYREWLAGTNPTNRFSSPAQLTIIPSGTNVILTWPTNAVGFTLQSTTNLASPAVWTTNSPAPVVIGSQNAVTHPISGAQRFYRLVK